ncbi:hypothetical protein [Phaeacidiphilus oryzae]|jgi:hypothetical protein|uniref:hypothetical protein n=1 Tax=Phaeacidiphilus oryzae TaxID=348818 RepID=UPI00055F86E3|nr:hypothetical protein [Phaeacidiphilus oryzae]
MKSTLSARSTANPRRTTLADVPKDAFQPQPAAVRPDAGELPAATANPRRTKLMVAPQVTPRS